MINNEQTTLARLEQALNTNAGEKELDEATNAVQQLVLTKIHQALKNEVGRRQVAAIAAEIQQKHGFTLGRYDFAITKYLEPTKPGFSESPIKQQSPEKIAAYLTSLPGREGVNNILVSMIILEAVAKYNGPDKKEIQGKRRIGLKKI